MSLNNIEMINILKTKKKPFFCILIDTADYLKFQKKYDKFLKAFSSHLFFNKYYYKYGSGLELHKKKKKCFLFVFDNKKDRQYAKLFWIQEILPKLI